MTREELRHRSRERAKTERLHTFKIAGENRYLVRSRGLEPGSMREVRVSAGIVVSCSCPGYTYRQDCTHAACVNRRLERESRKLAA